MQKIGPSKVERREDAPSTSSLKSDIEKESKRRRKGLRQLKKREELTIRMNTRMKFTIHTTIEKINNANQAKLVQLKKKIILIDIEKITLKTKENYSPDRALWVTIIDNHEEILLNRLIRWPAKSVVEMGTDFHGMRKEDIRYGDSLNFVRYKTHLICKEADIILTAGPEKDFDSLCYSTSDYNQIRRKIIDLGRLLSPRIYGNPIGLKYLSYALLQNKAQTCFRTKRIYRTN